MAHPLKMVRDLTGTIITKDVKTKRAPKSLEQDWAFKEASAHQLDKIAKEMGLDGGDSLPDGYIAGFASTPGVDLVRDVVVTGAFDESIRERGLRGPKGVKLLLNHDSDMVAGEIKVLETRGANLWIEAQLNLDISYVKDAYLAAKMIGGMSFSVGFRLQDYEFKENDDGIEILEISRGDLLEVSMVPFPAQPEAVMTFIKSHGDFEKFDNLTELEKALVANRYQVKNRTAARALVDAIKRLVLPKKGAPVVSDPELDLSEALALAKSVNTINTKSE